MVQKVIPLVYLINYESEPNINSMAEIKLGQLLFIFRHPKQRPNGVNCNLDTF